MCVICIEWEKGKLTSREALAATNELKLTSKHMTELVDRILEKEIPTKERDDSIEKLAIDVVEDRKRDKYGSS